AARAGEEARLRGGRLLAARARAGAARGGAPSDRATTRALHGAGGAPLARPAGARRRDPEGLDAEAPRGGPPGLRFRPLAVGDGRGRLVRPRGAPDRPGVRAELAELARHDHEVVAAVLRPGVLVVSDRERLLLAVGDDLHALPVDAERSQVLAVGL